MVNLFGPFAIFHGFGFELGWVHDDVFDPLAFPGVGDVHLAVGCLDDGRVGVFARIGFELGEGFPVFAVLGDGDVDGGTAPGGVIVYEEMSSILECDSVCSGAWVGEDACSHGGPCDASVLRPAFCQHFLPAAAEDLQAAVSV